MTANLFEVGVSLLGAGVVLKLTKDMSDNLTKGKEPMNKKSPEELKGRNYYRL